MESTLQAYSFVSVFTLTGEGAFRLPVEGSCLWLTAALC